MKLRQRLMATALAASMCCSALPTVSVAADKMPFEDVRSNDWYYDAVEYNYENHLMAGTSETTFEPNTVLNRAMIAQVLYNLEGKPSVSHKASEYFTDVRDDAWYANAVAWAKSTDTANGYGDKRFGPEDPLTREQMARVFMAYAEYKDYDISKSTSLDKFSDANRVSDWAQESMRWAVASGLLTGKGNGILDPVGTATRAEVASVMRGFVEKVVGTTQTASPTFESKEKEIENIADLNGGITPEIYCDDNNIPNFINGIFTSKKINSATDAIEALNDIHYIMQFCDARKEFTEVCSDTIGNDNKVNYYRLQQVYHNIPVYGHQLVVSADTEGNAETVSGHYYPGLNIDTQPTITEEQARKILSEQEENSNITSKGLCIYASDNEVFLTWNIKTDTEECFIDANTGELIKSISMVNEENVTGSANNLKNQPISFPVSHDGSSYKLMDNIRNVYITDAHHTTSTKLIGYDNTDEDVVTENSNDAWNNHQEAVSAYDNIIRVYDYYANKLGRSGIDKKNKRLAVTVNIRQNADESWYNAAYCGINSSSNNEDWIIIGDGDVYAGQLDVLAHEYTHAVTAYTWGGIYENESGALNEAYSDIMGDFIEEGRLDLIGVDENGQGLSGGAMRSFSNPGDYNQPSRYSEKRKICNKKGEHGKHDNCDNGNVHYNSGIINHAAWIMDQNWPIINHGDELANLFYRSMYYLSPDSTFLDCRSAVMAAAKTLNMSTEQKQVIANAFNEVEVIYKDNESLLSAHHIIGTVRDASNDQPIIDAKIFAVATEGIAGGVGYTGNEGDFNVKVNRAKYTVYVSAEGYVSTTIRDVDVSSFTEMNKYIETVKLTPLNQQNVFASGTVRNAITNETLADVTIKFRQGMGNKSGEYVQTTAGMDVELKTDSSGMYYTAALPVGNYTLEASKDGFVTGYANIISGNADSCKNQNIVLSPELPEGEYRIVLTWGENPSDLDSHVVGTLSDGSTFHTYYNNEKVNDGDIEVCNLDVDDTNSYGPETITLRPTTASPYYYYIYHYAGSGSMATSEAQIKLYKGNTLLNTYYVPTDQGDGKYWNVFAIVDEKIIVNNTVTSSANIEYADTTDSQNMIVHSFSKNELAGKESK